ncbi:MAG: YitT family protein [bacterium]|nr:YitT family protein [bacterium]
MEALNRNNNVIKYLMVTIGTIIMAVAINTVYAPLGLVTGGVSGIAIIVKYFTEPFIQGGVPIWLTNALVNIPLFVAAYIVLGKKSVMNTIYATVSLTVALFFIPTNAVAYEDFVLASIFGGVLMGIGLGLVFTFGGTTGGTDLLASIFQTKLRHYTAAQILMVIDGAIVVIGAAVFGINKALYAVIAVYITSKIMDNILEGVKFAKLTYIISDNHEMIAKGIMHNVNRGVTGIPVQGMYSNAEKNMLLCVVSKKEITLLIELVAQIDPQAFVIVSDVREVLGEGFIEYRQ